MGKNGAGDEVRTRDPQLGRLMLYQLSYSRECRRSLRIEKWWGELDSNQRRRSRQVYSLLPLTTRASPQVKDQRPVGLCLSEHTVLYKNERRELTMGLEPATC